MFSAKQIQNANLLIVNIKRNKKYEIFTLNIPVVMYS